jgi:hypothetical protein
MIPALDQRGKPRGNPPYLGSYEYVDNFTFTRLQTEKPEYFIVRNPVTDRLQIRDSETIRSVSILDLDGKTLQTTEYRHADIPLQNIRGGYYIVRFETEEGMFYEKLIIQK